MLIYSSYFNRLELAEQLFWLSESSGLLTGTQKNHIQCWSRHACRYQPVYIDIYSSLQFWGYFNRLELAEQLFWLPRTVGSLTGTLKNNIFSAGLDMHADISQYVDIYTQFWGYFSRLELAEQLFWLSESSGSLTGTQKNNIFSAGLDMHADISYIVCWYNYTQVYNSDVTFIIDWNLLRH